MYSYSITEFIIHPNNTYTRKNYDVFAKREWKSYKKYTPKISKGKITKQGIYHIFTEYRSGIASDFSLTAKLKKRKLIFFYPNRRGKMRKTFVYRRIDANK